MTIVIRIIANAAGLPCPDAGRYVRDMDFNAYNGIGHLQTTPQRAKALQFDSIVDAYAYYGRQSKVNPIRPDGKPNRPLTAYTISIEHC